MKVVKSGDWSYELYLGKSNVYLALVHEVYGLSEYIRSVARKLAKEAGVTVAAVDLYKGRFEPELEKAFSLRNSISDQNKIDALKNALDVLRKESGGKSVFGVMGFCMGGGVALLASSNLDYEFSIVFYGSIEEIDQIERIKGPILLIEPEKSERDLRWMQEKFIPAAIKYQKRAEIQLYPNAVHAFHNYEGKNHNPEAAKDAWEKTLDFISKFKE